jgi:hypothetical protein
MTQRQQFLLDTMADMKTTQDGLWASFIELSQYVGGAHEAAKLVAADFKKRGIVARAAHVLVAGGVDPREAAKHIKNVGGDASNILEGFMAAGLPADEAREAVR